MAGRPYFRSKSAELESLVDNNQNDPDLLAAVASELSRRKSRAAKRLSEVVERHLAALGGIAPKPVPGSSVDKVDKRGDRRPPQRKREAAVAAPSRIRPSQTSRPEVVSELPPAPTAQVGDTAPSSREAVPWADIVAAPPAADTSDTEVPPWLFGRLLGRSRTTFQFRADQIRIHHRGRRTVITINEVAGVDVTTGLISSTLAITVAGASPAVHRFRGIGPDKRDKIQRWFAECRFIEPANLAISDLNNLLGCDGYITQRQIDRWEKSHAKLLKAAAGLEASTRTGSPFLSALAELGNTWRSRIAQRNDAYVRIKAEENRDFFDELEANPLTDRQVEAILRDDDHTLVVAGAGTGKTSTVVGKIGFLIESGEVSAPEILALAFGRDAAAEMRERVAERTGFDVEIRTFHSLGLGIIQECSGERQHITDTASDERSFHALVARLVSELLADATTRDLVTDFAVTHRYPVKYLEDFDHQGDYFVYLRKQEPRTLRGERVKSFEELLIADWLILNGVDYEYEHPFEHKTAGTKKRQYKPDFYLVDYCIYLEHFGVDSDGDTAPGIDRERYHEGIEWKRELHQENDTVLVETYSWERMNGTLLASLKEKLTDHGVAISPMDTTQVDALLRQREVEEPLVALLQRFLTIFREGMWSEAEVRSQVPHAEESAKRRAESFLSLFFALERLYRDRLESRQEVDFSDMISRSVELLRAGHARMPFRRVIVDEYQDISRGRHLLLLELLKQTGDTRILCVGDDWQSIYGFTGSDIRMTTEFESRFGSCARVDLNRTFRFAQPQLDVTSWFVQKNESQLKKSITGRAGDLGKPIEVVFLSPSAPDYTKSVLESIEAARPRRKRWSVLLLGRYNRLEPPDLEAVASRFSMLDVAFMSVHKSKGLEADAVAILGLRAARYGFPSEVEDDSLLNLVLPANEDFTHAEERRVLYVAITRARAKAVLVADPHATSEFIGELFEHPDVYGPRELAFTRYACPTCNRGRLELTNPNRLNGYAWRCSLRPYCDHEAKYCQTCIEAPAVMLGRSAACMNELCRNADGESAD